MWFPVRFTDLLLHLPVFGGFWWSWVGSNPNSTKDWEIGMFLCDYHRRFWTISICKLWNKFSETRKIFSKNWITGFSLKVLRLTLSWRRPLSYRSHSIDLLRKSMDWFLYDNGLRQERVKNAVFPHKTSPSIGNVMTNRTRGTRWTYQKEVSLPTNYFNFLKL